MFVRESFSAIRYDGDNEVSERGCVYAKCYILGSLLTSSLFSYVVETQPVKLSCCDSLSWQVVVGLWLWRSADNSPASRCCCSLRALGCSLIRSIWEREGKAYPKTKRFKRRRGEGLLCRRIISEKSIKNTVILLEKRNTQRLIKSTHQTNGTYIYRINTKLKTYEHISWTFKRKILFFFFKGWKC